VAAVSGRAAWATSPVVTSLCRALPAGDLVRGRIPATIKTEVTKRMKRESETGMTPRSDQPLDFTTFGELSEIIKANWDLFGAILSNVKAVERVSASSRKCAATIPRSRRSCGSRSGSWKRPGELGCYLFCAGDQAAQPSFHGLRVSLR
jgi:hypothetical protein